MSGYNSSVAFKAGYYETEYLKTEKHQKTHKDSVVVPKHKKGNLLKRFALILTCFVVAFFIVEGYVMINETENHINRLKNELRMIEAENQAIKAKIDKSVDLKNLQNIAGEQFGMIRPENYQIFYIDLESEDYVEDLTKNKKDSNAYNIPVESVAGVLISSTDMFR